MMKYSYINALRSYAMNKKLQQHYWNPLLDQIEFVDEEQIIYTFNKKQESGTWNGWHFHENCGELLSVTDGVMVVCTKQVTFYVQANRAVWIPSGLEHEWYMPTKTANRTLFIHNSVLHEFGQLKNAQVIEVTPLLRELIVSIHELELDFKEEANRRLGLVLVDRVYAARKCLEALPMPQNHKLIELCMQLIIAPDTSAVLSDWSRKLDVSEKTLARTFVRETGLNFRAWQNKLRMQYAKKDLDAGIKVTDVALNCGYNSLSSFIAAFKRSYGQTPGAVNRFL